MPTYFRILATGFQRRGRPTPSGNRLDATTIGSKRSPSKANDVIQRCGMSSETAYFFAEVFYPNS
jgi:hypothetical protein